MGAWMWITRNSTRNDASDQILDSAVLELRAHAENEQLSPEARAFVAEEILSGEQAQAPSGLRHLARVALLVGAVPVVFGTLLLLTLGPGLRPETAEWVGVEKRGAEVVFTIADGSGSHRVLASTSAQVPSAQPSVWRTR